MPAPGTHHAGPLISGPRQYADNDGPANVGLSTLMQTLELVQNGANNVSGTLTIPEHCQILDFLIDNRVVWDSATSAGLTIGIAALGTEYVSSISLLAGGLNAPRRVAAPGNAAPVIPTAAQLLAMADTGTNKSVVATVAVVGATTTGTTRITMRYVQTTAWMSP